MWYTSPVTLTEQLLTFLEPAPDPRPGESFRAYLERLELLDHGFYFTELVDGSSNHRQPAPMFWKNLARTLALANVFRERVRAAGGAAGCNVAAAYRPSGGASNSAHKYGKALDLDAVKPRNTAVYFAEAVRLWCEFGRRFDMGLGLYTWSRWNKTGIRVHLDTGHGCRSWQGVSLGPKFARPYKILGSDGRVHQLGLPVYLANQMGLDVPSLSYL